MEVLRLVLTQCAFLAIALGAGDPPPLPSYKFGITGEPTKVDTAFGNLGELGPVYNVPEARNDTTATASSYGKPQTVGPFNQTTGTQPPEMVKLTSVQPTETSFSQEDLTTVKTTSLTGGMTLPGSASAANSTDRHELPSKSSPTAIPAQSFETTSSVTAEPTLTTTGVVNNATTNASNPDTTLGETKNPGGAADLSTPPSPLSSSSSSSFQSSSSTPPNEEIQGNIDTTHTTSEEPPTQTYHTGDQNSTDIPTTSPSPGQNATTPSKPNSSPSLHPDNGFLFTVAVMSFYSIKH